MVDQELIERVTRLSVRERLELIELLTRSLRGELATEAQRPSTAPEPGTTASTRELAAIEQLAKSLNLDIPADSSLHQLRGLAIGGTVPMTKAEVRDRIADYLTEKYS